VSSPSPTIDSAPLAAQLIGEGFVHLRELHEHPTLAWQTARSVFDAAAPGDAIGAGMPSLELVGEFALPPPGLPQRAFQALHIDFGLPITSRRAVDVARFTALYIDAGHPPTSARTRLVALRRLLAQRNWVDRQAMRARLRRYGSLQVGDEDYLEGILARLVEAADASPSLPCTGEPGFLCGLEFASRAEERVHLSGRGLELDGIEAQVSLQPGELLLFDNLATAHGRLGTRAPLELHQRCLGYPRLGVARQHVLLDRVLGAFWPSDRDYGVADRRNDVHAS
jgi:hypothetical protein